MEFHIRNLENRNHCVYGSLVTTPCNFLPLFFFCFMCGNSHNQAIVFAINFLILISSKKNVILHKYCLQAWHFSLFFYLYLIFVFSSLFWWVRVSYFKMLDFLEGSKDIIVILNAITKHECVWTLIKWFYFHFYATLLQVRRRTKAKSDVWAQYILTLARWEDLRWPYRLWW